MLKVILNKHEEDNVLNGYPWVFNNEIINFEGTIENGKVCSVYTFDHKFVAYGFLNTNSKPMQEPFYRFRQYLWYLQRLYAVCSFLKATMLHMILFLYHPS